MKVRFGVDVLNNPQAWDSLDQIVDYFITGRHLWDINDVDDIENSDWIQEDIDGRAGKRNLDTLQRCCTDSIYSPESRKHRMHTITLLVTFYGNSNNELMPDEAKRCLSEPAYVAVENQTSDGAFLDAMIHAFGRNQLRDAQTEGWWEYAHLGGFGEIEKRIEHIRAKTMGSLRILVVADSDRRYPDEVTLVLARLFRVAHRRLDGNRFHVIL